MNIIAKITDNDDKKAYESTKEIASISEMNNQYYQYIDDFISLLENDKSYIRTRSFILICCQAKWDDKNKIKAALPKMLALFHDEKPTVIRQCLNAIKEVIVYKPELSNDIQEELKKIDLSRYKQSMSALIQKDIDSLNELIKGQ